jgi:NAD(P)-dependent dehydrogenase (short-subunit alcohol dehydrogenase family)
VPCPRVRPVTWMGQHRGRRRLDYLEGRGIRARVGVRLQGARAVVTGGASGLGLAVAERLVELGARVVVLDLRPAIALPPGTAYIEADVGSEAAADRAMAEAVDVLGGLTLAVCCAGISHHGLGCHRGWTAALPFVSS